MPLIDMPLAELKQYRGTNPRPQDFDDYWNTALAAMRALDPAVELRPAPVRLPGVECFDLFYTGLGGSRIHAKYLRPAKRQGKCPAVLRFHGYTGSAGEWADLMAHTAMGFCVAALDVRGQGGQSEDRGGVAGPTFHGHFIRGLQQGADKLLFREIFCDAAQLAGLVMDFDEVDDARVMAFGASQGGALSLAAAALEPRIARAVVIHPFLSDYRRVWEMDLARDAYEELRDYFRKFDPLHEHEEEIFTRLGYIDVHHLAPRVRARVLFVSTLMDTVCPPSTQFAAYNALQGEKQLLVYPDFGHELAPGMLDAAAQFLAE